MRPYERFSNGGRSGMKGGAQWVSFGAGESRSHIREATASTHTDQPGRQQSERGWIIWRTRDTIPMKRRNRAVHGDGPCKEWIQLQPGRPESHQLHLSETPCFPVLLPHTHCPPNFSVPAAPRQGSVLTPTLFPLHAGAKVMVPMPMTPGPTSLFVFPICTINTVLLSKLQISTATWVSPTLNLSLNDPSISPLLPHDNFSFSRQFFLPSRHQAGDLRVGSYGSSFSLGPYMQ